MEMTALGAAIAAGLAQGVWPDSSDLPKPHSTPFTPSITADGQYYTCIIIYILIKC